MDQILLYLINTKLIWMKSYLNIFQTELQIYCSVGPRIEVIRGIPKIL